MPKESLTKENGVQKGPATDYTMLLEMKRRSLMGSDANGRTSTNGRKGTGLVVDNTKTRGFENGPAVTVFMIRGAKLGFLKF